VSDSESAYLTRKQVAQRLQLSVKTLANWSATGKGPKCARVCGGGVRYPLEEFKEWERKQFER
jgi:predicted DNA-binding transcriptional regulator AlpA